MRNRILLLHQIQPLGNDGVILVLVLPNLEQDLDHVLHALVDPALVQDRAEPFVHAVVGLRRRLGEEGADFAHEGDGDLDAVVCRPLEEEDEDLESEDLVRNLLVDEVSDKGRRGGHGGLRAAVSRSWKGGGGGTDLVVTLVGAAELGDEAIEEEFTDLGKLRVDDRNEGGEDGSEGEGGRLRAHDGADKEPPTADQVLAEELRVGVSVRTVDGRMEQRRTSGTSILMFDTLTLLIRPLMLFLSASQLILCASEQRVSRNFSHTTHANAPGTLLPPCPPLPHPPSLPSAYAEGCTLLHPSSWRSSSSLP